MQSSASNRKKHEQRSVFLLVDCLITFLLVIGMCKNVYERFGILIGMFGVVDT